MEGALSGIRILDLASGIAGPYACMLLSDMGAEVVKVEPPGGDPGRSDPTFYLWNRGKKSVAASTDGESGREVLRALVRWAGVLVEDLMPGEAAARGLDYETLKGDNPSLVYCATPPFGESGPYANKPADEGVVCAMSGTYGDQGGAGRPPVYVVLPIASYGTALMAAYGICAALFVRETRGIGQKVEIPLLHGSLAMQTGTFVTGPNLVPRFGGRQGPQGVSPTYRLYKAADEWFFIACGNNTFWNKLTIALGREELVEDHRFQDMPWGLKPEDIDALTDFLADIFRQGPRQHWLELLARHDVPCAPVQTREEYVRDPQLLRNGMVVKVVDHTLGLTEQMGLPVAMAETPGRVPQGAPRPGQHTEEVLLALGYSGQELARLRRSRLIS